MDTHVIRRGCALAALLVTTAAHAQDAPKKPVDAAVAVRVSTLGLGLELSKLINPNVAARVGFNTYSYNHDFDSSDITYGGQLRLRSISALADLYPGKRGAFHLTAGLLINNNKLSGQGKSDNGTFTINGDPFSAQDVGALNADVTFPNKVAPYLGIGFGKPSEGGSPLRFVADIGVVFQGKPRVSLTSSNLNALLANPATNATGTLLASDLAAQQNQTQHDVDKFNIYPVVSLGIAYHF